MTNTNLTEAITRLFIQFHACAPKGFKAETNSLAWVIAGLANKALTHCTVAKDLLFQNHQAEAAILLRSAFEAVVIMHYVLKTEGAKANYQLHGELVLYKDRLVSFHAGNYNNNPALVKAYKQAKNKLLRQNILKRVEFFRINRYNEHLFEDGSILDNPEQLARSIKPYFTDFYAMSKKLNADFPADYNTLQSISVTTYNVGSQIAHSQWQALTEYSLGMDLAGNGVTPRMNEPFILFGMVVLMDYCFGAMDDNGLSNNLKEHMKGYIHLAVASILAAIKSEKQDKRKGPSGARRSH